MITVNLTAFAKYFAFYFFYFVSLGTLNFTMASIIIHLLEIFDHSLSLDNPLEPFISEDNSSSNKPIVEENKSASQSETYMSKKKVLIAVGITSLLVIAAYYFFCGGDSFGAGQSHVHWGNPLCQVYEVPSCEDRGIPDLNQVIKANEDSYFKGLEEKLLAKPKPIISGPFLPQPRLAWIGEYYHL